LTAKATRKGVRIGGRQKGTPNKTSAATRERIEREADPIGFLIAIQNGEPFKVDPAEKGDEAAKVFPSLDQRITAATTLAKKVMPDMKAVEHDVAPGAAVKFVMEIP
jgi:hypothetical protein